MSRMRKLRAGVRRGRFTPAVLLSVFLRGPHCGDISGIEPHQLRKQSTRGGRGPALGSCLRSAPSALCPHPGLASLGFPDSPSSVLPCVCLTCGCHLGSPLRSSTLSNSTLSNSASAPLSAKPLPEGPPPGMQPASACDHPLPPPSSLLPPPSPASGPALSVVPPPSSGPGGSLSPLLAYVLSLPVPWPVCPEVTGLTSECSCFSARVSHRLLPTGLVLAGRPAPACRCMCREIGRAHV